MKCLRLDKRNVISWRLIVMVLIGFLFLHAPSYAGEFTIPWTVDLTPLDAAYSSLTTPSYDSQWGNVVGDTTEGLAIEADTFAGDLDLWLELESSRQQSYSLSLPFEVHVSAPDQVVAGQTIFLDSYALLSGTPYFTVSSDIDFSTKLNYRTQDMWIVGDTAGSVGLPNAGAGGLSATFNGSAEYTATDTSADELLTRTIWKEDPFGQELNMPIATRFEGYELNTSGNEDAWEITMSFMEFASNFVPALDTLSLVADIEIGAGLDIKEETSLTTQFVTGYYSDDDNFLTYDDFLINGADSRGWITIPDTLAVGDTYDIQMSALGLGFTTLIDYYLQGNIDFELELLSLFDIDLGEINLGDPLEIEDWVTRYQFVEFMNPAFGGFLTPEQFAAASLSFEIVDSVTPQDPTKTPPEWEMAQVDPLIGELLASAADPLQESFNFDYNPEVGPSVITPLEQVPEPCTLFLFGAGLLCVIGTRKRFA